MGKINQMWRRGWLPKTITMLLTVILYFSFISAPNAAASLINEPATVVKVSLSNTENELKFFPNEIKFVVDHPYKLILSNPSSLKHYFTAKDFADAIWTSKVESDKVEVKGAIREVELRPGAELEWVFVPLKVGTYSLRCPIAGHTEAGMVGQITISANVE